MTVMVVVYAYVYVFGASSMSDIRASGWRNELHIWCQEI